MLCIFTFHLKPLYQGVVVRREAQVTLVGDPSLSGKTEIFIFDTKDFEILGRALELMYLTKGNRAAAGLMLEAQYDKNGLIMKGFVDVALAMYHDISNFVTLSVMRDRFPV
jgi:hypothetical protein